MNPMRKLLWLLLSCLLTPPLQGQTAEERGLEIAREADRRDSGFGDYLVEIDMLLRNRQGDESRRLLRGRVMEVAGDGDKSMLVIDKPRDVEGTVLLTHTHKTKPDDLWLYLPALKRVKRIAARNKSGPFMGSEFAYEDLLSQEIEKYSYRFIRETRLDVVPVFLLERYPLDEYSGYGRQLAWINLVEYRPEKIEFYDHRNLLLKTLVLRGYRKYLGRYWRADEMDMHNHQTGKSTLLTWTGFRFRNGFSDADFNRNALKRMK